MIKSNYHTHTYRCGHAFGNEEDMIKSAIELGLEEIGICCHIPLPRYRLHLLKALHKVTGIRSLASLIRTFITGGPNIRMPYKMINEHLNQIDYCKEKYKDEIAVYKGFEAEGIEDYFDFYHKVDYLILGNHFHKYCIHSCYYGRKNLTKEALYNYCEDVEKALETQLFSYLAHPDLFIMGYHDFGEDMQIITRRICKKAKELNIPLEINAGGIRRGKRMINGEELYLYPNPYFFKIASEIGNDVIIGIDAHDPKDMNREVVQELERFAKELNLNLIGYIKFLKGNN